MLYFVWFTGSISCSFPLALTIIFPFIFEIFNIMYNYYYYSFHIPSTTINYGHTKNMFFTWSRFVIKNSIRWPFSFTSIINMSIHYCVRSLFTSLDFCTVKFDLLKLGFFFNFEYRLSQAEAFH